MKNAHISQRCNKTKGNGCQKREKKNCFSVLFPRAKQQTSSVDVGNEDSLLDFTSR